MTIYTEVALATRLRQFAESLSADAEALTQASGVDIKATQFYIIYALATLGPLTMTDIAQRSGFTHSAVSQQVKRLVEYGLIRLTASDDGRTKTLGLSGAGKAATRRLRPLWAEVEAAVKGAISETGHDFMAALDALEQAFARSSLAARVTALRDSKTERAEAVLIPYDQRYGDAFARLNLEWLKRYFVVEPVDETALKDPDGYILSGGGEIWYALHYDKVVGTFALKNWGGGRWEFTKFAVDPDTQGLGIGGKLMRCATDRFQARGGKLLFLDTNTKLEAARAVYDRYGWVELPRPETAPYNRADCYMEWKGAE